MFTAIKIDDSSYNYFSKEGVSNDGITELKRINIFVGQNNSGKSRFMRNFVSKSLKVRFDNEFNLEKWQEYRSKLIELIGQYTGHADGNINSLTSMLGASVKYLEEDYNAQIGVHKTSYKSINDIVNGFKQGGIRQQHRVDFATQYNQINSIPENFFNIEAKNYKKVYIPLMRGLKNPVKNSNDDLYGTRTIQDYWTGIDTSKFEVFSGLTLFKEIRAMLLGKHEQRESIRNYETFISDKFFNGEKVILTPFEEHSNDVLHIKIGDNEDRAIYDVGDGIQSIIILTFPLFKYRNQDMLLFIEEPENGLHPGMQRIILETLNKGVLGQTGEHQFFITTHSNHLLDTALEKEMNENISIYQFQDTGKNQKHIKNISQNKIVLDLLGVRNSSVFLSNCIIWVEGVSDRIYIKKWLELYNDSNENIEGFKRFEEDKHYTILEYGGSNITHFNFGDISPSERINTKSINTNNFVVADNDGFGDFDDKTKDAGKADEEIAKRMRLRNLKKILDNNFFADCPEIENLISYEHYKKYFSIKKGINWQLKNPIGNKIAFNRKIHTDDIGKILKNIFIELKSGKTSNDFTKGKDISIIGKKIEVAERMTNYFDNFNNLSTRAKFLTKELHRFISENNL